MDNLYKYLLFIDISFGFKSHNSNNSSFLLSKTSKKLLLKPYLYSSILFKFFFSSVYLLNKKSFKSLELFIFILLSNFSLLFSFFGISSIFENIDLFPDNALSLFNFLFSYNVLINSRFSKFSPIFNF